MFMIFYDKPVKYIEKQHSDIGAGMMQEASLKLQACVCGIRGKSNRDHTGMMGLCHT